MEKTQKEYYLNEQMQAIQKELGERDEFKNEVQEIEEKLRTKRMSKEATLKVKKELKKLRMMSPMSAEATVVRNYIDWILSLPWYEETATGSTWEAEKVLSEDPSVCRAKERIRIPPCSSWCRSCADHPVLVGPPGGARPRWPSIAAPRPASSSSPGRRAGRGRDPRPPPRTSGRCRAG
jgi:ATP-dependent Lon protease